MLTLFPDAPERIAIRDNGIELSYQDLQARVRAVARGLPARPGVVGVPATHHAGTIAALFGVWAAGGAYCPVDPCFPDARREAMLTAAGCSRLISGSDLCGSDLSGSNLCGSDLCGSDLCGSDLCGSDLEGRADNVDDLAYVLFTSGSSGVPKAVLTPHSAIVAAVASVRDLFGITPDDRVLQFASLNWDTCFEEILPALTAGACLVFHDDAYTGSFPRFMRLVERERITVLDLPTAFWHELVHHLVLTGDPLPVSLRLIVIGGEAANPARVADWHCLSTGSATLLNTYGSTETTLITHACVLTPSDVESIPIGSPLPHVRQRVDADGELWIGGPSLALGYRGLADATRDRFVDGWFRTGDRVRARPDGSLVSAGRADAEVKVRGIRVDPAEVEAHISAHPGVGAVGVAGARAGDHTVLVAYVVAPDVSASSIRDFLRDRVPAHLIPSRIHIVADLVYTASGKVDRRRLEEALA